MTDQSVDRRTGLTGGTAVKAPVRVATTAAITLAALQTIDAVVLADSDRVLVKNQADTTQNGIYVASSGNWTRALDFDDSYDFVTGTFVKVTAGATYAGVAFACTVSDNPPAIDSSTITWAADANNSPAPLAVVIGGTGAVTAIAARESLGAIGQVTRNFTFNGAMELWGSGTAVAPTGWTLAGTSAAAAKNTTAGQFRYGAASVTLTRSGHDATLTQDVDTIVGVGPVAAWQSRKVTVGAWVYCATAAIARVGIDDGVTVTYSSYHTGNGAFQFLTASATLGVSATRMRLVLSVDTSDGAASFDGGTLAEGGVLTDWLESPYDRDRFMVTAGSVTAQSTSVTNYYGPYGTSTTEAEASMPMPFKCVVKSVYAQLSAAQSSGSSWTITGRKNAADVNVAITLGTTVQSGHDTANHDLYAAGDLFALKVVSNGSVSSAKVHFAAEVVRVPL